MCTYIFLNVCHQCSINLNQVVSLFAIPISVKKNLDIITGPICVYLWYYKSFYFAWSSHSSEYIFIVVHESGVRGGKTINERFKKQYSIAPPKLIEHDMNNNISFSVSTSSCKWHIMWSVQRDTSDRWSSTSASSGSCGSRVVRRVGGDWLPEGEWALQPPQGRLHPGGTPCAGEETFTSAGTSGSESLNCKKVA